MFRYITKSEYFNWIEEYKSLRSGYASASENNLKDIQDHYALSLLHRSQGLRVLEIGGADCRVLRNFSDIHECWNAEKFEGTGAGPKRVIETPGVRNALVFLGEFSKDLPDDYFDLVFSVSVVEHVPNDALRFFFKDIARVLKRGGVTAHAIDVYMFNADDLNNNYAIYTKSRLQQYMATTASTDGQLAFVDMPVANDQPVFRCEYATNSDRQMLAWNKHVPHLTPLRAIAQSVSLMAEWTRLT